MTPTAQLQELHNNVCQWMCVGDQSKATPSSTEAECPSGQVAPEAKSRAPCFAHKNRYVLPCDRDDVSDSEDEGDNDEDNVMACLNSFAHAVQDGPKLSQKERKKRPGPQRLTKRQIADIVHKISTGQNQLPDLQELHDDDLVPVWALLDAGSAVHVVDFAKHLPGIAIRESTAQRKGVQYLCAGGAKIPNNGEGW